MTVDYETEYNNRARVPEHGEIFARWDARCGGLSRRMKAEENAELGLAYGPAPRQNVDLFSAEATGHAPLALFIHGGYWRSLRAVELQPHGGRAERARHRGRGRGLRSVPAGHDRADHRADPHGLPVPVAPLRPAPDGVRPFGRRASGRLHGGDRLEEARSEGAGRSGAGRLFDLRPVRSRAADAHRDECRSASSTRSKLRASRR